MSEAARTETRPELLARYARIRKDPVAFLECVRTQDQVDRATPIKAFPVDLDYVRLYAQLWSRERLMAAPKSRRMIMSWTNVALFLWETLFNVGVSSAFVSKKEDDANELIDRAEFIYDHLDPAKLPRELLPQKERKFGQLSFPEINSKIMGFPQGADQLRQFTFSGILADEMAFWEDAQKMFAASFPTLEGGGRFTAISTRAPSFFKRLVYDTIDTDVDAGAPNLPPVPTRHPIEGVEIWRNPRNKFLVFQLHYRANPLKRTEEWKTAASSGMPRAQWNQEYEGNWDSFEGLPVYGDFDPPRHLLPVAPEPQAGLPLLRGWDFGLTPACVVAQLVEDQLVVLREFTELNMGAKRFSEKVLRECAIAYPEWSDPKKHWRDYIDPSGEFRKDTDEGTCAKILDAKGLRPIPGPVAFEERRQSVEQFLVKQTKSGPCFAICEGTAPVLVRGFKGGYRYPESAAELEPNKLRPVKDEHSHPHDALQYIASRVVMMRRSRVRIPALSYGGKSV